MMTDSRSETFPGRELLAWYEHTARNLPWRETTDPYNIWVSEIMLQQTRVDTVVSYYRRFLNAFPTVNSLAIADRQDLLRIWEGLGYYSRARNLQDAAREIINHRDGRIPESYEELRKLKGIGPYTAAAIASIAFGEPRAAVDGNVIRVLSRYFLVEEDIRSTKTKNHLQDIADSILNRSQPGDFNQALMELGATICTPGSPACGSCPLASGCLAAGLARTEQIPWKTPQKKVPHHQIAVGIVRDRRGRLLIALRPEEAMLGGLWEFPGGKQKRGESLQGTVTRELYEELGISVSIKKKFMQLDHAYSHFRITLHAFICRMSPDSPPPAAKSSQRIEWATLTELPDYPFPKANRTLTDRLLQELEP